MRYVLYVSLFISLMAFIHSARLAELVSRKYRYKYKLTMVDKVLRITDSFLRCLVPGLNIVILLVTKEMVIDRIEKDDDYELRT